MGRNSHQKLTGDRQKDSYITKAVRNIHTELGRKGREAIRSGPVSLGGDTKEEGDPYRGVNGSSHILGTPALRTNTGKTSLLSYLENQCDYRRAVRNLDSSCEECIHTCLLPKQGRESTLRLSIHGTLASFPWPPQSGLQPEVNVCTSPVCNMVQLHTRVKAAVAEGSAQL